MKQQHTFQTFCNQNYDTGQLLHVQIKIPNHLKKELLWEKTITAWRVNLLNALRRRAKHFILKLQKSSILPIHYYCTIGDLNGATKALTLNLFSSLHQISKIKVLWTIMMWDVSCFGQPRVLSTEQLIIKPQLLTNTTIKTFTNNGQFLKTIHKRNTRNKRILKCLIETDEVLMSEISSSYLWRWWKYFNPELIKSRYF